MLTVNYSETGDDEPLASPPLRSPEVDGIPKKKKKEFTRRYAIKSNPLSFRSRDFPINYFTLPVACRQLIKIIGKVPNHLLRV